MYLVGLTGGIASGKSAVSSRLASKGAYLVDADQIAREIVEPGSEALREIEKRFGPGVVSKDGSLDRDALGKIVFDDPVARKDLERITHPKIGAEIARRVQAKADTDEIVILDAALLVEGGRRGLDCLLVVAASPDIQLERMMRDRSMTRSEAEARIAAQAPLEEKLEAADIVVWNEGTLEELDLRVDEAWEEILSRAEAKGAHS